MGNRIKQRNGDQGIQLAVLSGSKVGVGALNMMQENLNLAGDELLRMEDESGIALSVKQTMKVEVYTSLACRVKKLLQRVYSKL